MLAGLWLLLFVLITLILIYKSVLSLLDYFNSRDLLHLKKVILIWLVPLMFMSVLLSLSWVLSLKKVNKDNIIGHYEVDDRFYPGSHAAWQKNTYRFEVRSGNQFILYVRLADNLEKEYKGDITWANEATEKWSISMVPPHHVVDPHPVLYRERFGFYYVFRTKKFGNMFFRKTTRII